MLLNLLVNFVIIFEIKKHSESLMSYIPKTISEVITEYLNKTTFLPAIQREYVWDTYAIEK